MGKIEIGEYVRMNSGYIFLVTETQPAMSDETGSCPPAVKGKNYDMAFIDQITKHSKDITDLIEDTDILQVEVSEEWTIKEDMIRFAVVGQTYTISEIKECLENGLFKIKQIVTHEQFEQNSYKVGV